MTISTRPRISKVDIGEPLDFVAQSLAPDCRTLGLVSDGTGNGLFEIFLYDLKKGTLRNITAKPEFDEGKPVFAPHCRLLAYLSNNHLALYDYAKFALVEVANSSEHFKSAIWSESGTSLYLEDEATNIWQYDLQPRRFRQIWKAPRPSYSPRSISARRNHLLFVSDHESEYSQIYQLDLQSGAVKRLFGSPHDQHTPIEINPGDYTFRTIVESSFIAAELRNGGISRLSPPIGVTYDLSLEFGRPLLMYSNDRLPASLYWSSGEELTPLLSLSSVSHQPCAIPIKNADGMTNFLYLPSKTPDAWLIWLHGGPHEQISPRFNLYFDFLTRKNIAVYAINYPGSTGMGNSYALSGKNEPESIAVQLPAVERDIEQLSRLYPQMSSFMLVGVSYGSILAHLVAAKHKEVARLVDFSGIADSNRIPSVGSADRYYPPILVIYGDNDFALKNPARWDLISRYEKHRSLSRLALHNEGHFIQRRGDIDQILRRLETFLVPAFSKKEAGGES